jgi:hypothetical protein
LPFAFGKYNVIIIIIIIGVYCICVASLHKISPAQRARTRKIWSNITQNMNEKQGVYVFTKIPPDNITFWKKT